MTSPLHRVGAPSGGAAPSFHVSPRELPKVFSALASALKEANMAEAQRHLEALRIIKTNFDPRRQLSTEDSAYWQQIPAEKFVVETVHLWLTVIQSLEKEELYEWVIGPLHCVLESWSELTADGIKIALVGIRPEARGALLIRIAQDTRRCLAELLESAASTRAPRNSWRFSASAVVVGTGLDVFQNILSTVRLQIKEMTSPEYADSAFHQNRLRRLTSTVGVSFTAILLIRITAVILGGVMLARSEEESDGVSGLSMGRFALNTLNIGATFLYERICQRREAMFAQHTDLFRERAELKKAMFQARDWSAAFRTLRALERSSGTGLFIAPANLQAGWNAIKRVGLHEPTDPISGTEIRPPSDIEGGEGPNLIVSGKFRELDLATWLQVEHQVEITADCIDRLLDPIRDAMQGCVRSAERIGEITKDSRRATELLGGILERQLGELYDLIDLGEQYECQGLEILNTIEVYGKAVCGGDSASCAKGLVRVFDYAFAASSWLMGGLEAFAPLEAGIAKQVLLGGAVIDTINSGTAPFREAAFARSEAYQKVKLRISEAVSGIEGILPLAKTAANAFSYIRQALRSSEDQMRDFEERAREAVMHACELSSVAMAMAQLPLEDPNRTELFEIMCMRDRMIRELLPEGLEGFEEPCPDVGHLEKRGREEIGKALTSALAEAALLSDEGPTNIGVSGRQLPSLRQQLQRAAQSAENQLLNKGTSGAIRQLEAQRSPQAYKYPMRAEPIREIAIEMHSSANPQVSEEAMGVPSIESRDRRQAENPQDGGVGVGSILLTDAPISPSRGSLLRSLSIQEIYRGASDHGAVFEGETDEESGQLTGMEVSLDSHSDHVSARAPGHYGQHLNDARRHWAAIRGKLAVLSAQMYLGGGEWRQQILPEDRGLRIWRVMRAALILSAARAEDEIRKGRNVAMQYAHPYQTSSERAAEEKNLNTPGRRRPR